MSLVVIVLLLLVCWALIVSLITITNRLSEAKSRVRSWADDYNALVQEYSVARNVTQALREQGAINVDSIEITRDIEVIRYVEKPVYPQRFNDPDIARDWVLSHTLPVVIIADGWSDLTNIADPRYDCDDYADDYESLALSAGISLWQAPVTDGQIWGVKVSNVTGNHVGLWTKINGTFYYVEPQPVDSEWRFVELMRAD